MTLSMDTPVATQTLPAESDEISRLRADVDQLLARAAR
jgi:hypothetical protein